MLAFKTRNVLSALITLATIGFASSVVGQGPALSRSTEWRPVRAGTSSSGTSSTTPSAAGLRETNPPRLVAQPAVKPATVTSTPERTTSNESSTQSGVSRLGPRTHSGGQPALFWQDNATPRVNRVVSQPMTEDVGEPTPAETLPPPASRQQVPRGVGPFWSQQPRGMQAMPHGGTITSEVVPEAYHNGKIVRDGDVIYEGGIGPTGEMMQGDVFIEGSAPSVHSEPGMPCGDECSLSPNFFGPNCFHGGPLFCWPRFCDACQDWCWTQDLTVFVGPHSFQGPLDNGQNGNFGFHYGVNYAIPLWHERGWGLQIGGMVANSNLNSNNPQANTAGSGADRTQYFVTIGWFRRAWFDTCGWQYGVAYDLLQDDYFEDVQLTQIRAEASRRWGCHEFGFTAALQGSTETLIDPLTGLPVETEAAAQYKGFWRYHYDCGAETRLLAGVTDDSDVLVGGDAYVTLTDRFALQADFNYLIPNEDTTSSNADRETWAMNMNVVWFPGRTAKASPYSRYRPLFDVANNGSFFIRR